MAKLDPEILAHLEWLGFVRPTGLVVSAPALVRAGAILDRRDAEGQRLLRACVADRTFDPKEGPVPHLLDFRAFASSVLGWSFSGNGYAGTAENPIPLELEVPLPDYGETLRADFAVRELEPTEGLSRWQLLVRVLDSDEDFDRVIRHGSRLEASAHGRMERLLRQTGVPAGLLFNQRSLRLLSAPRGESSGWLDFRVADMLQTAGRPILSALRLLLGQPRLLSLPRAQRLAALLEDSRKFQNEVSERLAQQVLHALYELLRGFQAAQDASKGELLRQSLIEYPDEVYRALLNVILRLVFLLYAEERDMLPEDETFLRYYSLAELYERLREDAALFPDTMDQRFGAWAQLLVLFRMIHDGAESGTMQLPRRHGVLFDPDRFNFLEGRPISASRATHERIDPPLVPDGTIYRALEKLLVLDGERISYRALDVEQIGSVYETMMGFRLEKATGRSVAIKAQKKHGASTAVDIEELLREPADKRGKWLQDRADRKFTDSINKAAADATTLEDLHAALLPVIDLAATPDLVPSGAMVLQPSQERRRSGSHYTPRALTEPIVRTTLAPILAQLRRGDNPVPLPERILDLKVCDPAMGSGAFLVEVCRQLGDALIEAWHYYDSTPLIPSDEDEVVFARRLIAQRCLYGLDLNPVAVDLAKVSLWLATLAEEHALTFVDHALRHGDSLIGLSVKQIEALHWDPSGAIMKGLGVREPLEQVSELRRLIRSADESVSDFELRDMWIKAQLELDKVRLFADLVAAAAFEGGSAKDREQLRNEYANAILTNDAKRYRAWLNERRNSDRPFAPFHWEIEFQEVFTRENPGFDAVVGNPPFLGGTRISNSLGHDYLDYLVRSTSGTTGNVDLAGFFLRRSDSLLRLHGVLGVISTNSVKAGDSGRASLSLLQASGRELLAELQERQWPGASANVAFLPVCLQKMQTRIGELIAPKVLGENRDVCNRGCDVFGAGFVLSDSEAADMRAAGSAEVIHPYIGGEEFNNSPILRHSRYIINFNEMSLTEAQHYHEAFSRVERMVKPKRAAVRQKDRRDLWWLYATRAPNVSRFLGNHERVLAIAQMSKHIAFAFLPKGVVFSNSLLLFLDDSHAFFSTLQSGAHYEWIMKWAGAMRRDVRYTSTDCFETFPRPENWQADSRLEAAGRAYYEFRAAIMIKNEEGLTKIYNRFHDPEERDPDIKRLREIQADLDSAVFDGYGWHDISVERDFLLDSALDDKSNVGRQELLRYRWPAEIRDKVLERLLELNAHHARAETRSGNGARKKRGTEPKKVPANESPHVKDLFS